MELRETLFDVFAATAFISLAVGWVMLHRAVKEDQRAEALERARISKLSKSRNK